MRVFLDANILFSAQFPEAKSAAKFPADSADIITMTRCPVEPFRLMW